MSFQMLTPGVRTYSDGREVCDKTVGGKYEYTRRTKAMARRQGFRCAIGGEHMEESDAQFEHEAGRGSGGGHRDDRIEVDGRWQNAAVCGSCNGEKGSKRYSWQEGLYLPCPSK